MNTLSFGRRASFRHRNHAAIVVLAALWLSACGSGGGTAGPFNPSNPIDPGKPENPFQSCYAADWEDVACPEGMICVGDILGTSVANITPITRGNRPDWSADNRRIAFHRGVSSRDSEVFVINADGRGEVRLSTGKQPAWSPQGNRIAFVSVEGIAIMQDDGSGIVMLIPHDFTNDVRNVVGAPAWSPDGQSIVFVHFSDYANVSAELYVMNVNGSDVRRVAVTGTTGLRGGIDPAWSSNGGKIAFVDYTSLTTVDAAGGDATVLVSTVAWSRPDWFPDASMIAFTGRPTTRCGPVNISTADGRGAPVVLLAGALEPAWSPDGSRIAFASAAPEFPPVVSSALAYSRTNLHSEGMRERYVLYADGKFELQTVSLQGRFFLYTGHYSHVSGSDRIDFSFDNMWSAAHPVTATANFDGSTLSVRYNGNAVLIGFENGLFVLSSTSP